MNRKVLFLHVTKTAGCSINHSSLANNIDEQIHFFRGKVFWEIRRRHCADYFKFGFVRNPFDRFVSLYFYFFNMSPAHRFYKYNAAICREIQQHPTFKDFCIVFHKLRCRKNFHFYPQHRWLCRNGSIFADFVGRMENITEDLTKLSLILGVEDSCQLPHINKSEHDYYTTYYDQETIGIVEKLYKKDLDFFEYMYEPHLN